MIKKLFLTTSFLTLVTLPIITSTSLIGNSEQVRQRQYLYDNKYFSSYEEILKYFVTQNPDAINLKSVIGDVNRAIIDFDDGILNSQALYDNDESLLSPAYVKSNGQITSSLEAALNSYAQNSVFAKKYQGANQLFATAEQAKLDRQNNFMDLYQSFYNFPSLTKSVYSLANSFFYNPLNQNDYFQLLNMFSAKINDPNFEANTNAFAKNIQNASDPTADIFKFLANTKYESFDTLTTAPVWPDQNDNNPVAKTINVDYQDNLSQPESGIKIIGSIEKAAGNTGSIIKVSPFINSTQNAWDLTAEDHEDGNDFWDNDGYTAVHFASENSKKEKLTFDDPALLKDLLYGNSANARIYAFTKNSYGPDSNRYVKTVFDLNTSPLWKYFQKKAQAQIQKVSTLVGEENFTYQLTLGVNPTMTQGNTTGFVRHFYEDISWTLDDKHYVNSFNSSYLTYQLDFKLNLKPENILVDLTNKFLTYYDYVVNYQGKAWDQSIAQIFATWINFPVLVKNNQLEPVNMSLNETKIFQEMIQLINNKDTFSQLEEVIQIKNSNPSAPNYDLFKLKRNDQITLSLATIWDKNVIKDKVYQSILEINDNITALNIDNYPISNVIMTVLDFLISNNPASNWNDMATYNQLIQNGQTSFNNITLSYEKALKAFAQIGNLDTIIAFSKTVLDQGFSNSSSSYLDIMQTQINNLYLYLKHYQNQKAQVIDLTFLLNNDFIQKARFNVNYLVAPALTNYQYQSPNLFGNFKVGTGKYLLLNNESFNKSMLASSSFSFQEATKIFFDNNKYDQNRQAVIYAEPPKVWIFYDDNNQIIYTNSINDLKQTLTYDDYLNALANLKHKLKITWDKSQVYYQKQDQKILISNQISNIYTLKITINNEVKTTFFRSFDDLQQFLLTWIKQQTVIVS